MANPSNPDIKLLFGVLGGGSIAEGTSGGEIKKALEAIIKNINAKPLEIEVQLSKNSTSDFTSELHKLTKDALAEAEKIKTAYKNISIPQISTQTGGSKNRNTVLGLNTTEYYKAIAKVNKVIETLQKNQANWTLAKTGQSAKDYSWLGTLEADAKKLKTSLETGTMSASEFSKKLTHIATSAQAAASSIKLVNEDIGANKGVESYRKQLDKVNAALANVQKNLREWTKAKSGSSSMNYQGLENAAAVLEQLQKQLIDTGACVDDFDSRFKKATADIASHSSAIKAAGENTKTLGERVSGIIQKFSSWYSVSQAIMQIVQLIKQMVSNVVELDAAMTELKKVTDETDSAYISFLENASVRAKQLGATLTDVVSATADFSRLGYGLKDASTLADVALLYKNIGDDLNGIDDATQSLTSTMQAFGHGVKDAESIVDIFNAVSNTEAISSGGLGAALQKSAAAMSAANNSLEETVALISAANFIGRLCSNT